MFIITFVIVSATTMEPVWADAVIICEYIRVPLEKKKV